MDSSTPDFRCAKPVMGEGSSGASSASCFLETLTAPPTVLSSPPLSFFWPFPFNYPPSSRSTLPRSPPVKCYVRVIIVLPAIFLYIDGLS